MLPLQAPSVFQTDARMRGAQEARAEHSQPSTAALLPRSSSGTGPTAVNSQPFDSAAFFFHSPSLARNLISSLPGQPRQGCAERPHFGRRRRERFSAVAYHWLDGEDVVGEEHGVPPHLGPLVVEDAGQHAEALSQSGVHGALLDEAIHLALLLLLQPATQPEATGREKPSG